MINDTRNVLANIKQIYYRFLEINEQSQGHGRHIFDVINHKAFSLNTSLLFYASTAYRTCACVSEILATESETEIEVTVTKSLSSPAPASIEVRTRKTRMREQLGIALLAPSEPINFPSQRRTEKGG